MPEVTCLLGLRARIQPLEFPSQSGTYQCITLAQAC